MKNKKANPDPSQMSTSSIPEIDIIDLDSGSVESPAADPSSRDQGAKRKFRFNIHMLLLVVTVLFVSGIIYKILTFGVHVDLDEIFKDGPGTYEDNYDTILPLFDSEGNALYKNYGEGSNILVFGNAPFADDRDSEDNLANMIQQMTGATVYNCSVSGSYLAAEAAELNASEHPTDIFNFYWLCSLATGYHASTDREYRKGLEILGDTAPPEAEEVYNTLTSLDLNTIDVIGAMYDGSDYLAAHEMYNDANATDLTQFTGNMEAGIELLNVCYPNIRIIILSPAYAYALDENGNYVSSDMKRYGPKLDVLSTYVIKQYGSCCDRSVTFVDNLYGTINEDHASKYLTDHLHLNVDGRKKVAERFVYALNYYSHLLE